MCRCSLRRWLRLLFVAIVGVIIERLVVRPLWDRKATMFVMILATLAVQIVIDRATLLIAAAISRKSLPVFTDLPPLRFAGISIGFQTLWIVGGSLILIAALAVLLQQDAGRPGDARLLDQSRGGRAAGHPCLAHAGGILCA